MRWLCGSVRLETPCAFVDSHDGRTALKLQHRWAQDHVTNYPEYKLFSKDIRPAQ